MLRDAGDRGLTKTEIVARIGNTTLVTVQRALNQLRDEKHGAKIDCRTADRRWRLREPFTQPLVTPEREDLVALLVARAIVEPHGDRDLEDRLTRLVEALDDRMRARTDAAELPRLPHPDAIRATLTLGTPVDPGVLRTLLAACRRQVVRIDYESPWRPADAARTVRVVEPWAVRVHDGAVYLRAWDRQARGTRTFRVAQIVAVELVDAARCGPVPTANAIWAHADPGYGIDEDRPDVAVVRVRGAVARWLERIVWHPAQKDVWLEPRELLERRVAYRSCREMARRVASVIDGVEAIEPVALHDEVARMFARWAGGDTARGDVAAAGGEGARRGLPAVMYRAGAGGSLHGERAADGEDGDGG